MKKFVSILLAAVVMIGATFSLASCSSDKTYVRMTFKDFGEIVIEVDHKEAPKTANHFVKLVESGYYDGLLLTRAQQSFVLQGGDGNEDSPEIDPVVGEFESNGYQNDLSHTRGAISMARTNEPDSAVSTFFICLSESCIQLDGNYAAFGYVVEGMDVVDSIVEYMLPYGGYMGFVTSIEGCVVIESASVDEDYTK